MYFILYSYCKNVGFVWKGIKKPTDLRVLPRRDRAPCFEIPGSATDNIYNKHSNIDDLMIFIFYSHTVINGIEHL